MTKLESKFLLILGLLTGRTANDKSGDFTPGGTPLYGLYRYMRPQRVWFSAVLVINRVSILADFGHFGHK